MIDGGLTQPWPPEVMDAARLFQQGDLIVRPPIAYAAALEYPIWSLTRLEAAAGAEGGAPERAEGDGADPGPEEVDGEADPEPNGGPPAPPVTAYLGLDPADVPPFGIITTQTCDIAEDREDSVPLQPWFEIAPVYTCAEDDKLAKREYIYRLDDFDPSRFGFDPTPDGERWVADLRLRPALEKSILAGREPIDPFADEERPRIAFGVWLGQRIARAALAGTVNEAIEQTLDTHRRKTGKRVGKRVYKMRIDITQGTRLKPRAVRLHAVCRPHEEGLITDEEMTEWFESGWEETRKDAEEQHGINLLKPRIHKADAMDVEEYDWLVEIRCPLHKR